MAAKQEMTLAEAQQAVAAGDERHQDGRMVRTASRARWFVIGFVIGMLSYERDEGTVRQRHGLGEQLDWQAAWVISVAEV
jgi:hypothetical protein